VITYRADLDVPQQTLVAVSRWLAAHRRINDARPWQRQRAAPPYVQAIIGDALVQGGHRSADLGPRRARQHRHAHRYLHEAIYVPVSSSISMCRECIYSRRKVVERGETVRGVSMSAVRRSSRVFPFVPRTNTRVERDDYWAIPTRRGGWYACGVVLWNGLDSGTRTTIGVALLD